MSNVSSAQTLLKIDVGSSGNHKVYAKIDIDFMSEKSLKHAVNDDKKKKVSDEDVMQFIMQYKEFVIMMLKEVMN